MIHRPLSFDSYIPDAYAFYTTRGKSIESDPFSEYNLSNFSDDAHDHIMRNRLTLCAELGVDTLITPQQVHKADILEVTTPIYNGCEPVDINADAVITTLPNTAIAIATADCVPLVLYSPTAHIAAAVHSGWRSTVLHITGNVINRMVAMGANIHDIHVAIGNAICPNCFEVGDEVCQAFSDASFGSDISDIIIKHPGKRSHINLIAAIIHDITATGIPHTHITSSGICTKCNHSELFSARALGVQSGRTLTGIIIR